jgi:hypothetical protein
MSFRLNSITPDGGAFHADAVALDRLGGLDGDLIVGGVAVLDAEVVIFQVQIEVGVDQLVLDLAPDDPGHLVAVELDDRVRNLDLIHLQHTFLDRGVHRRRTPAERKPDAGLAPSLARVVPGRKLAAPPGAMTNGLACQGPATRRAFRVA